MKKTVLPALLVAIASGSSAQNLITQTYTAIPAGGIAPSTAGVAVTNDTLGWADFQQHNIILYGAQTGYVFGSSVLVQSVQGIDITQTTHQLAAGHIVNDDYDVTGAMILAGVASPQNATQGDLTVRLYSIADNKAISDPQAQTPDAPGPDQTLGSVALPFADLNVGAGGLIVPTFVEFASPVFVNTDFAVALDISALYGTAVDTVALFADEDGDSDGTMTWTNIRVQAPQGGANAWVKTTAMLQGGLDVNVGLFPIVQSGTGIDEESFLNGMKLGQNSPNPAAGDIVISYELQRASDKVSLNVYDASGRLAAQFNEGERTAGRHSVTIADGQLSPGTYFYNLRVGDTGMVKKMVVVR
jgi:hypothetical protein